MHLAGASAYDECALRIHSAVVTLGANLDGQRLVSGHGLSACARLLAYWFPAQTAREPDVDLEYLASIGGGLIAFLRLSGRNKLAAASLFPLRSPSSASSSFGFTLRIHSSSVGLPEVEGTQSHSEIERLAQSSETLSSNASF